MNEITEEWIFKAESDFILAQRAIADGEMPLPDGACFHAQQCAEKYLKAFLQERQVEFPRRHELIPLLELCLPLDAAFERLRQFLVELESYAVAVRYPGIVVSLTSANSAIIAASQVRQFVRNRLGYDLSS